MAMTQAELDQGLATGTITQQQYQQAMMANAALATQAQTPAAMTALNSETGVPTTGAAPLAPVSPSFMSPVVNPNPQLQVAAARARGEPPPTDAAAAPVDPKSLVVQAPAAAAAGAPGATSMQPAVAPIQYGIAPAHAAGLTPAERAYVGAKDKLTEAGMNADQAAIDEQEKRKAESEANTKYLLDQQALATAQFAKEQEEEKQKRARLVEDARTNDGRIQKQIAEQEAQGIDPSKYYTDQSVGQKILGAFAVGIGALGAGPLGPRGERGQNVALNMMQQAANQEIDAQKANFQHSLALLGKRMDLNHEGFNQQEAMLKAEQDSVQSTYNVAIRQIESQAARYKDNDHVQEVTANLVKGLRDDMMAKLAQGIDSHLAIARKASTPVGGGLMVRLPNGQVGTMEQYNALQKAGVIQPTAPEEQRVQAQTLKELSDAEKAKAAAKETPEEKAAKETEMQRQQLEAIAGTGSKENPEKLKSTNWEPQRNIQGTGAFDNRLVAQQWNTQVMGIMHQKYGARSPEAMEKLGEPYIVTPGDSQDTINRKKAAVLRNLLTLPNAAPGASNNPAGLE